MEVDENKLSQMPISSIEDLVDEFVRGKRCIEHHMIKVLIYLKTSGRYKENPRYANSSFYQYIDDRFNLRTNMYMEMQTAYVKFPVETIKYGIGLVCKIRRECGPIKAQKVFNLIGDSETNLNKELKRDRIEKIIRAHSIVKRKEHSEKVDWKSLYEDEVAKHEKTKLMLKEANRIIIEKNAQIERLKKTISDLQ